MRLSKGVWVGGLLVVAVMTASAPPAVAQESRVVHLRMPFKTESLELRTNACLRVSERSYPAAPWWESTALPAGSPERAFKDVIAAMKQKDRATLLKLTDPAQARDTAKFEAQANAFFQQFGSIRLVEVRRAYEFDDLVVFFGKFQSAAQTVHVPMAFGREGDNTFGFLPMRATRVTYKLVNDWFSSRPAEGPDASMYCADADLKRATHRVELVRASFKPSTLLLTGGSVGAPGPVSTLATRVRAHIDQMKTALTAGDMETFYRAMTPEGGGRLRQWFATASPDERSGYTRAFLRQEPFFVFDQGDVAVVYVFVAPVPDPAALESSLATQAASIQVLYFAQGGTALLWANSSHVTTADSVFKGGPLAVASGTKPPFGALVIK